MFVVFGVRLWFVLLVLFGCLFVRKWLLYLINTLLCVCVLGAACVWFVGVIWLFVFRLCCCCLVLPFLCLRVLCVFCFVGVVWLFVFSVFVE